MLRLGLERQNRRLLDLRRVALSNRERRGGLRGRRMKRSTTLNSVAPWKWLFVRDFWLSSLTSERSRRRVLRRRFTCSDTFGIVTSLPRLDTFRGNNGLYIAFEYMPISLEWIVRSPSYPDERQLAAILGQVSSNSQCKSAH